ncbi:alpha/beta hydrolase fold family protein [Mycobacterium intracellulare]|nr:alpha/beta hydrolase fold family protein [Mycobacterium intracellulare]
MPPARPEPIAEAADRSIDGRDGPIPVRVYRPDAAGPLPIVVYAHGGGFVFCDLDSHDGLCRNLANLVPAVVVSVGYRLAPENPWPAAAEDVYSVTRWAYDNAGSLGPIPAVWSWAATAPAATWPRWPRSWLATAAARRQRPNCCSTR